MLGFRVRVRIMVRVRVTVRVSPNISCTEDEHRSGRPSDICTEETTRKEQYKPIFGYVTVTAMFQG